MENLGLILKFVEYYGAYAVITILVILQSLLLIKTMKDSLNTTSLTIQEINNLGKSIDTLVRQNNLLVSSCILYENLNNASAKSILSFMINDGLSEGTESD